MSDISKALAPNAPVVTNENGGKQSDTPYGFHMLPASAMFAAAEVGQYGAKKYGEEFGERNYTKISAVEHVNHALQHLYGYLAGDVSDNHLAHAIVRCMFAFDVNQQKEKVDEENFQESSPCKVCKSENKPLPKKKEDIINDAWIALRTFHYCNSVEPRDEREPECWFGFDAACYLLASDMMSYTGKSLDYEADVFYDCIRDTLQEVYKNVNKSNLSFYALYDTLETYVDQLAERVIEIFKEENKEKGVE